MFSPVDNQMNANNNTQFMQVSKIFEPIIDYFVKIENKLSCLELELENIKKKLKDITPSSHIVVQKSFFQG